jgi:ribosomal protein L15E
MLVGLEIAGVGCDRVVVVRVRVRAGKEEEEERRMEGRKEDMREGQGQGGDRA